MRCKVRNIGIRYDFFFGKSIMDALIRNKKFNVNIH